MKFGIFLILLSCCFYLAVARPSDSDEFDDDSSELGSDSGSEVGSNDGWLDEVENPGENMPEYEGLNEDQIRFMEEIRLKRIKDHAQGKAYGSPQATKRLQKELHEIFRSEFYETGHYNITLIDGSLYDWNVHLLKVDPDSQLHKDLKAINREHGINSITFHFKFKDTYPFEAPFVRLVSPVISGSYVMEGGAICLQLLTAEGWSSVTSIESVLVAVSSALVHGNARILPQDKDKAKYTYSLDYAKQGFARIEKLHKEMGWYKPPDHEG